MDRSTVMVLMLRGVSDWWSRGRVEVGVVFDGIPLVTRSITTGVTCREHHSTRTE